LTRDKDPQRLIRSHLLHTEAYAAVSPLEALSQDAGVAAEHIVKLDGNENPYGCSPRVREALAAFPYYHVYPDTEQRELRKALEGYVGVSAERLVAGSGSDELIDLAVRLFVEPGEAVINCPPTFGMYSFSTGVCGGRLVEVPRDTDFAVDVARVRQAIAEEGAKLVFIASPNNPSGNTTPKDDIRHILETGAVVVLDEAYYEFSGQSMADESRKYDNLVILRTFSKWAGLAGLRVGYGIFPESIVRHLMRVKPPYNVNAAGQVAALESLRDIAYLRQTVQAIIAERQRLLQALSQFEGLRPLPSEANFLLCHVAGGRARAVHQELRKRGISVRYFDNPRLEDFIRISVGRPEHTDALIAALKQIC